MRRIAAGMNHGAAMRHGKARLCRAECPPHFLFVLSKRKRAGHGTKEKALRDELPGKAVNSPKTGGWPSQTADQIQKSPTGCAIPIPPRTVSPHQKVRRTPMFQTGRPLPFFPLPLPRPTPGGVSKGGGLTSVPRPRERVSKGRGPQPSPFVSLGVQGEVETPWCFSSGVWGGFFSRKECAPRPCGGNRPLRE